MTSEKGKKIFRHMGKVILIALLIVFLIRCFFVESYSVSSSQIEPTVMDGDQVFVDKTAYGIRMPVTPLCIPFTFDSFLGCKSYSQIIELPYKRVFEKQVSRNDIVLYNNPIELDKPLDKRSLILNRCVYVPGDTVVIEDSTLYYSFVVPGKNTKVELTENNLNLYKQIIISEQQGVAKVEYDRLYIKDIEVKSYTFVEDYYWTLTDGDGSNSLDSRSLGFIPARNVVGKVSFVWFSTDKGNPRWERVFTRIIKEKK